MTIQNRPGRIGNRIILVIPLDQDRVEGGDAPPAAPSGPLDELRQRGGIDRMRGAALPPAASGESDAQRDERDPGERRCE